MIQSLQSDITQANKQLKFSLKINRLIALDDPGNKLNRNSALISDLRRQSLFAQKASRPADLQICSEVKENLTSTIDMEK
jgi:hypothetical protein